MLMIQVCRSLAEAHALGLVHRDIKPANIFLSRAGNEVDVVKVLDFGLVHDAHKPEEPSLHSAVVAPENVGDSLKQSLAQDLTQQGASMGTPSYMAPEQVLGHAVLPASDVYALGCVMVFLLTGKKLFNKPDTVSLMMAHVVESVPAFESWATIPKELALLVRACLEKQPADRPKDGQDLLGRLEALEPSFDLPWTAARARTFWSQVPEHVGEVLDETGVPQRLSVETPTVLEQGGQNAAKLLVAG
jgi:eukaryotic-like serine/threonine-protein kinase